MPLMSYLNNTSSNITEFHTFTKGLILFKSSCETYHLWYTKDHFSMFSPDEMVTPTPTLVDYSCLRVECSPSSPLVRILVLFVLICLQSRSIPALSLLQPPAADISLAIKMQTSYNRLTYTLLTRSVPPSG